MKRSKVVVGDNRERLTSKAKEFIARFFKHPDAVTLLLGTLLGIGVCAPLLGGGRLYLLDWVIGPHAVLVNSTTLGLNGGLTSGVVSSLTASLLNKFLGGAVTWLPVLLFFPIATVGAGRLASRSIWSRIAAGTLYAVNPFVFNRIYAGHLVFLIGYALLPFAITAARRSIKSSIFRWFVPALWWAGLTALSPHFAWIYGVVILGVAVLSTVTDQRSFGRSVAWFSVLVVTFALLSVYILLPHTATNLPTQVGSVSLDLYRTTGDPHLGLFANVLALYGFWRLGPGPVLPKNLIGGWPFLMLTILFLAGLGIFTALGRNSIGTRTREILSSTDTRTPVFSVGGLESHRAPVDTESEGRGDQRHLSYLVLFIAVSGFFLALGSQGPTGSLFQWTYDHVPFFALMREPQKFLMLFVLALAVLFGWGVERFSSADFSKSNIVRIVGVVVVGIALPLGYTANIFDGLGGQIALSSVPPSYQLADKLMGSGAGNILYLPWHLYMSYPFTNNRVVTNIGPGEFRRTVISGDNVESGNSESQSTSPRSAFLQQLFADSHNVRNFGLLVAPLGVQFVVLAKTVDWKRYAWLRDQKDLKVILDSPSLEVWRNIDYSGVGWRASVLTSVTGTSALISGARFDNIAGRALVLQDAGVRNSVPLPLKSHETPSSSTTRGTTVRELSPVAYRIEPGTAGWVTVDVPYQRGWTFDGRSAKPSAVGTLLVRVGTKRGVLLFTPWRLVRLGYLISGLTFLVLLCLIIFEDYLRGWRRGANRNT
jgi:hypothetical protein